jgi:hypothetical protein
MFSRTATELLQYSGRLSRLVLGTDGEGDRIVERYRPAVCEGAGESILSEPSRELAFRGYRDIVAGSEKLRICRAFRIGAPRFQLGTSNPTGGLARQRLGCTATLLWSGTARLRLLGYLVFWGDVYRLCTRTVRRSERAASTT